MCVGSVECVLKDQSVRLTNITAHKNGEKEKKSRRKENT
jgi:hypothetical protein